MIDDAFLLFCTAGQYIGITPDDAYCAHRCLSTTGSTLVCVCTECVLSEDETPCYFPATLVEDDRELESGDYIFEQRRLC